MRILAKFAVPAALLLLPAATGAAQQPAYQPAKLANIERTVQRLRQLSQLHAVRASFLSDRQFNQAYSRLVRRDSPPSELSLAQREYVLLGLLKKRDDLQRILSQSFGPQIGGVYDSRQKVLYVRNHGSQVLGLRRDLIAHEYTHALQDQHYNLLKMVPNLVGVKYRNSDAAAAHKALVEGDAVNLQSRFIYATYSPSELSAFAYEQSHLPKPPPVPVAIQRFFDFSYDAGYRFVQTLTANGGMAGIDGAYRRLPGSTYEIMHPAAYRAGWKAATVSLHTAQGFSGWRRSDDDVMGALGYDVLLWQYLQKKVADRVTDAYRGDRYIFLEQGSRAAILLSSVWSSPASARTASNAVTTMLRARYGSGRVQARFGGTTANGGDSGAYLKRKGNRLTLVFATDIALAKKLGTAQTS